MRLQTATRHKMELSNGWGCLFICSVCSVFLLHLAVVKGEKYTPLKVEIPENVEGLRFFTDDDIAEYDGSNQDKPIYMAVKGVVFDVTSGKKFYGNGASYNALTGKDSSRAVAKMSLQPEDLTSDLSGLSDAILKSLDDIYSGTYEAKYPIVGYMTYLLHPGEDGGTREDL